MGVVSVKQGETILSSSPRVPFELEFFPPSLRSATFGAVAWLGERRLEDWLGLDVRDGAGGAVVTSIALDFDAGAFFDAHEKPPYDGKITKADLGKRFSEVAWVDGNGDGVVTRVEAEEVAHAREKSSKFAAKAGLKSGDVIVKAAGRPVGGAAILGA